MSALVCMAFSIYSVFLVISCMGIIVCLPCLFVVLISCCIVLHVLFLYCSLAIVSALSGVVGGLQHGVWHVHACNAHSLPPSV